MPGENPFYDAIIIGGGPAGLSAALVLGRCRRRVAVFDTRQPRNAASAAMHGFLSRDGVPPGEFLQICREQLARYPEVHLHLAEAIAAARDPDGFTLTLADRTEVRGRLLLLATGLIDELPDLPGFRQCYGQSIHHCPYCDGWEHRDQPIAIHGGKKPAAELAIELRLWSRDLVLCTDGPPELADREQARLAALGISINEAPIATLESENGQLRGVRFVNGSFLERSALFFSPGQWQHSRLGESLGCRIAPDGTIACAGGAFTGVPGLYAAGNTSSGLQLVIMAAAEGTLAAFSMNESLLAADTAAQLSSLHPTAQSRGERI